jgi:hypothetical protein
MARSAFPFIHDECGVVTFSMMPAILVQSAELYGNSFTVAELCFKGDLTDVMDCDDKPACAYKLTWARKRVQLREPLNMVEGREATAAVIDYDGGHPRRCT